MAQLLHDLEVHQAELEMQNEELRVARLATEAGLERYAELFDFAPIGYVLLSPSEHIREVNLAGAQLLGRERSRLIGERFGVFISIAARDDFRKLMGKLLAGGEKQVFELELFRGPTIDQMLQVRLTAIALGRSETSVLMALEDITDRKAKEYRLSETERALREADLRKDEFLAVLSHELRNPLAPMRNSLAVLHHEHQGTSSDTCDRAQAIIERQLAHLTRLVDDLLDVTRISKGKIQLQYESVELGDLIRRTMDDHRLTFETKGIHLEDRTDADPIWVKADGARLVQVLSNLLGNAEKFTQQNDRVVVTLKKEAARAILSIRDTGIGITSSVMKGLFEPFAQAPQSMDRSRGGLGLGLAMAKGLVELHGGTVRISSDGPGLGTELTISLPLEVSHEDEKDVSAPARTRLCARSILIIDDNQDAAESLSDALEIDGHQVRVALNGPAGLEAARRERPEIILCDIGLPGMDGFEVARTFRDDPYLRKIHLVALSGYARPEDLRAAKAAGFDRHVAKPPNLDFLRDLVSTAPGLDDGASETAMEGRSFHGLH